MSLARRHQARILAAQAATFPSRGGHAAAGTPSPAAATSSPTPCTAAIAGAQLHAGLSRAAATAAAQIKLRMTHDLRRLHEIRSVEAKIAAKRDMLPEYRAWCDGELEAGRMTVGNKLAAGAAPDVLPTVMIWSIDIGDWPRALELAAHVLRFDVALPSRYKRDAASLVVEEIAEAALKLQGKGERFPLDVLEQVEELTAGADMHDEIRAKLMKAIGVELDAAARAAAEGGDDAAALALLCRALPALQRASDLHSRVGAKTIIRSVEKALAKEQAGAAG